MQVSYPQLLALARGANFFYNFLPNRGIKYSTLTASSGFRFKDRPYNGAALDPDYAIGLASSGTIVYNKSTSTDLLNSQLIYKYGGNLSDTSNFSLGMKSTTTTYVPGTTNAIIKIGDWLLVQATASAPRETGLFKLTNKSVVLSTNPTMTVSSRIMLTSSWKDYSNTTTNYTYQSSVQGNIATSTSNTYDLTFTGFLNPLEGNNTYSDCRFVVGYFREHGPQIVNVLYNPSGSGIMARLSGNLIGFHPFYVSGQWTWYAIIIGLRQSTSVKDVFLSTTTGLNAHVSQQLRVVWAGTTITWYANGANIASIDYSSIADFEFDEVALNAGCAVREQRSTSDSLPNNVPTFPCTMTVEKLVLLPNPYISTTTTLDDKEISYHNTGLILLKKLK